MVQVLSAPANFSLSDLIPGTTEIAKKSRRLAKENKIGIFALTTEQLSKNGKKGGIISANKLNTQKWMCLETGMISTIGPLTRYQRVRGIDTSKKIRVE